MVFTVDDPEVDTSVLGGARDRGAGEKTADVREEGRTAGEGEASSNSKRYCCRTYASGVSGEQVPQSEASLRASKATSEWSSTVAAPSAGSEASLLTEKRGGSVGLAVRLESFDAL